MYKYEKNEINGNYENARRIYAAYGVDTDKVLDQLAAVAISLHCWQGDDVTGFESGADGLTGGGILATGNYRGRARNGNELRQDIDKALALIPGTHKVNLHAIYAETGGRVVERDELTVEYFTKWIQWAKEKGIGLDFNPSFFSHKMAEKGFTLSSKDKGIRDFWVRHGKQCREIAYNIGKALGKPCVNNFWIPDGSKDLPANRMVYRKILKESLDEIFAIQYDKKYLRDAVESKLFGIGSEAYVVGSHEFYMGYAMKNDMMMCLDAGHFHPTEVISDKISSILIFSRELLLHVSRGVRWDSDHVVILNDELQAIAQAFDRVHIALDFFDASINRIIAWVIGARATQKALLMAMLEPSPLLARAENADAFGDRLALMEEFKALPVSAVWNKFCLDKNVPVGTEWLEAVKTYEESVLMKRA